MKKRLLLLLFVLAGIAYATQTQAQVCDGPLSVTITGSGTGSPLSLTSAEVTTPIPCNGGTATVTFVVSGGTLPYSFTFNGETNATGVFAGVFAGTGLAYSITDANNCGPITGTIDVVQPTMLDASISSADNSGNPNDMIICPGGTADLTASGSGGTGDYTYAWNPNIGSGAGPHTVNPGTTTTYTVTITDENGCMGTATKEITVNPALSASIAETDDSGTSDDMIICPGGEADLTASGSGGTGTYTYAWDPSIGSGAGPHTVGPSSTTTYTVTVTDANGCTASATKEITVNPALSASIAETDDSGTSDDMIICPGGEADLTASGSGGTGAYTYAWDPSIGSGAGPHTVGPSSTTTYTVTVTDANGCTASATKEITVNPALSASIAETDNSGNPDDMTICPGDAANLTASGSGGTGAFSYAWNPNIGSGAGPHPASPGTTTTYTVTVTDANGCTATATKEITVNPTLSITSATVTSDYNGAEVSCAAGQGTDDDGEITVVADGGTPGYMYSKDNGANYQASNVFTGLTAGTYTIVVKDDNGCTASQEVTITAPDPIEAGTCNAANDACQLEEGQVKVAASGGTGVLNITWTAVLIPPFTGPATGSPPGTAQPVPDTPGVGGSILYSGLSGNTTYNFTVTDENGCQVP